MDHGPYDEVGDAQEYLTAFASGAVWSDEALKLCDRSMLVVDALRHHRDVTDQAGLLMSPVAQRVDWQMSTLSPLVGAKRAVTQHGRMVANPDAHSSRTRMAIAWTYQAAELVRAVHNFAHQAHAGPR
jgi:hypothetical protein